MKLYCPFDNTKLIHIGTSSHHGKLYRCTSLFSPQHNWCDCSLRHIKHFVEEREEAEA